MAPRSTSTRSCRRALEPQPRHWHMEVAPFVAQLREEARVFDRLLRANQLQHRRGLYLHRMRGVQKRCAAALSAATPQALDSQGGPAAALVAVELALSAIPPACARLRHLLAQTYFMPLALTSLALLSRSAKLLAQIHASLSERHGASPMAAEALPRLLALVRKPESADSVLSRVFGGASDAASAEPQARAADAAAAAAAGDAGGSGEAAAEEEIAGPAAGEAAALGADADSDDLGEAVAEDGRPQEGTGASFDFGFSVDATPDGLDLSGRGLEAPVAAGQPPSAAAAAAFLESAGVESGVGGPSASDPELAGGGEAGAGEGEGGEGDGEAGEGEDEDEAESEAEAEAEDEGKDEGSAAGVAAASASRRRPRPREGGQRAARQRSGPRTYRQLLGLGTLLPRPAYGAVGTERGASAGAMGAQMPPRRVGESSGLGLGASASELRAEAMELQADGRGLEAIAAWRRLLHADTPSASDLHSLGVACAEYADGGGGADGGEARRGVALRCAARAFRGAAELAMADGEASGGAASSPRGGLAAEEGDDDAAGEAGVLSRRCGHIRRSDVSYILPHVRAMLSPTGTNRSWRSLFNMAPPSVARPAGRHDGKVFGVGLSKTGVTSLRFALHTLGWRRASAMDLELMPRVVDALGPNVSLAAAGEPALAPWRKFLSATDASTDLPNALFAPELHRAFPDALFVLTTRPVLDWWASASRQMGQAAYTYESPIGRNRALAYGDVRPNAFLYTKRYVAHALEVMRSIPCERLLLMDIARRGEGWPKLAPFLRVEPPGAGVPFPHGRPVPTVADAPPTAQRAA